ncbi:glycoside hydrolase family 13 protein [Halogeometricum luteum]|uniref:Alpha-glucosidase n=1 Tax=Halogeometricum luteum TaxID=2950537 RepID=A0ABU2FYY3_9EURY|nr:alpha-glucosidase [Halogeometricum sp. S3BR5-2]MDS0293746.1 alpha-glucosidase [Halogeometricum sp. S3BR5-2]
MEETTDPEARAAWWKEAVVYEIYPRSFNDSDGDGVGDIPGIVEKADYLDDLGVDVVWLCPVYASPDYDNGYDISDYRAIHEQFGTMADWEELLAELHARDIRLVMDLVVNHTSSQHEWFRKSRRRAEGYDDYYIWRDGDGEDPPNNWESVFGGPAWSYDDAREQWYLHLFHEEQPDLNWRTPAVRADVAEMMRWWLEKGIDGFRMDAVNLISKAEGLPDGDPSNGLVGEEHVFNGPSLESYLRELYDEVLSEYDAMTVAEMPNTDPDTAAEYLGEDGAGLNMIFQFEHMDVDAGPDGVWDLEGWGEFHLPEFKRVVSRWQTELWGRGWNSTYLGNHDQARIVSRYGDVDERGSSAHQTQSGDDEAYRRESATLLATFLLTMGGTPYLYQGDEIGMTNVELNSLEEIDDVETVGAVEDMLDSGEIDSFEEARGLVNYTSRDHARTPMQWSDDEHAGFTDGEPWYPVNENYPEINVAAQRADEGSIWHYYRRLVDLRHEKDVFVYGAYDLLLPDDESFYAYTRTLDEEVVLVVLNWSGTESVFDCAALDTTEATVVVGNGDDPPTDPQGARFGPYEAVVYRL